MGKQHVFSDRHDMRTGYAWLFRLLILVLCLAAASCALGPKKIYDWPQQEGVVIDKETGEPIAGVWVTGRWRGRVMGDTVCFHADATQTDAQGRFVFPAWRNREGNFESSYDQNFVTNVYKQGYQAVGGHIFRWEMVPFVGSREERLNDLEKSVIGSSCMQAGISGKNLYPYYEAVYMEAKSTSHLPEDAERLDWFRKFAATVATSSDRMRTHAEGEAEINQFLKEHLK
jgi:hypothetical protein